VLVDGNQVVCTPGGPQGTVAALDSASGNLLWQSKDWTDGAQYASIVKGMINGKPQYVQLTQQSFAGLDPKTGAVLWKQAWPGRTAVIPTPIISDNSVFITSGYGAGCTLVKISPDNQVSVVYENKVIKNHHGGVILYAGHLYGFSDGIGWVCMDFASGAQVWAARFDPAKASPSPESNTKDGGQGAVAPKQPPGKGAIACADGKLYCLDEAKGTVVLIDASDKGWTEHGRLTLAPQSSIRSPQGHIWTHPVISGGKLYLRDQEYIYCYDIKG
jgi:outer membrane protein assembly factor BamB